VCKSVCEVKRFAVWLLVCSLLPIVGHLELVHGFSLASNFHHDPRSARLYDVSQADGKEHKDHVTMKAVSG